MKNFFRSVFLMAALVFGVSFAFASYSENARVIREDKNNHDLLVERLNGELWLLQHNPACSSMTTEFPVSLISEGQTITQLKVAANEICKVYRAFRYDGEAVMAARVPSDNQLHAESQAELIWSGKRVRVDYGKGCLDIREMVGKKVYISLPDKNLEGGSIILPGNRGQCVINKSTEIGVESTAPANQPPKLEGLEYQAQNNQVYFYWNPVSGDKPLYLVSYSRYKLDPNLYTWNTMPNLKITADHSYTAGLLGNGVTYYFYLASLGKDNVSGVWSEVVATPVGTGGIKNNPDETPFDITMTEQKDSYKLTWPSEDTVRKYRISLYVSGKLTYSSLVKPTVTEYVVPNKPEYKGKGLRFTVRSLNKTIYDRTYSAGKFWQVPAKP